MTARPPSHRAIVRHLRVDGRLPREGLWISLPASFVEDDRVEIVEMIGVENGVRAHAQIAKDAEKPSSESSCNVTDALRRLLESREVMVRWVEIPVAAQVIFVGARVPPSGALASQPILYEGQIIRNQNETYTIKTLEPSFLGAARRGESMTLDPEGTVKRPAVEGEETPKKFQKTNLQYQPPLFTDRKHWWLGAFFPETKSRAFALDVLLVLPDTVDREENCTVCLERLANPNSEVEGPLMKFPHLLAALARHRREENDKNFEGSDRADRIGAPNAAGDRVSLLHLKCLLEQTLVGFLTVKDLRSEEEYDRVQTLSEIQTNLQFAEKDTVAFEGLPEDWLWSLLLNDTFGVPFLQQSGRGGLIDAEGPRHPRIVAFFRRLRSLGHYATIERVRAWAQQAYERLSARLTENVGSLNALQQKAYDVLFENLLIEENSPFSWELLDVQGRLFLTPIIVAEEREIRRRIEAYYYEKRHRVSPDGDVPIRAIAASFLLATAGADRTVRVRPYYENSTGRAASVGPEKFRVSAALPVEQVSLSRNALAISTTESTEIWSLVPFERIEFFENARQAVFLAGTSVLAMLGNRHVKLFYLLTETQENVDANGSPNMLRADTNPVDAGNKQLVARFGYVVRSKLYVMEHSGTRNVRVGELITPEIILDFAISQSRVAVLGADYGVSTYALAGGQLVLLAKIASLDERPKRIALVSGGRFCLVGYAASWTSYFADTLMEEDEIFTDFGPVTSSYVKNNDLWYGHRSGSVVAYRFEPQPGLLWSLPVEVGFLANSTLGRMGYFLADSIVMVTKTENTYVTFKHKMFPERGNIGCGIFLDDRVVLVATVTGNLYLVETRSRMPPKAMQTLPGPVSGFSHSPEINLVIASCGNFLFWMVYLPTKYGSLKIHRVTHGGDPNVNWMGFFKSTLAIAGTGSVLTAASAVSPAEYSLPTTSTTLTPGRVIAVDALPSEDARFALAYSQDGAYVLARWHRGNLEPLPRVDGRILDVRTRGETIACLTNTQIYVFSGNAVFTRPVEGGRKLIFVTDDTVLFTRAIPTKIEMIAWKFVN